MLQISAIYWEKGVCKYNFQRYSQTLTKNWINDENGHRNHGLVINQQNKDV